MRDDRVIIDYDRHKKLLEKEELWDKYKKDHTYGGVITAIVCNYRDASRYLNYPVDKIDYNFSPNTPEEVQGMIKQQVERLEAKMENFRSECDSEAEQREALKLEVAESLDKIPNWVKKIFI